MADNVQWIKLKVGMFDGNSFKKIKRAKIAGISYRDKLTAIWFELLDLAGKSNANGYLIDNNEIPYHTFEDIAIMLDREEKEIELCMQFFINEKMIEIIDDVYCLTNFMKYQNEDALEKIREQKRIAQAKWRERKKQGLIGFDVDTKQSTVESTDNLLSISNSISTSNSNLEDKKEVKHKYGVYNNVLLKDSEYNKLEEEYPLGTSPSVNDLITFLDEYIEMKGYKAKSHYLAIKKWVVNAVKDEIKKHNNQSHLRPKDNFMEMLGQKWREEDEKEKLANGIN